MLTKKWTKFKKQFCLKKIEGSNLSNNSKKNIEQKIKKVLGKKSNIKSTLEIEKILSIKKYWKYWAKKILINNSTLKIEKKVY